MSNPFHEVKKQSKGHCDMVYGKPVFEFAVYRKKPDELYEEYAARFEKQSRLLRQLLQRDGIDPTKDGTYIHFENAYYENLGRPYPYNQIIGWVQLIPDREQMIGEYFMQTVKRMTYRCNHKPIKWQGQAFILYLKGKETDSEITAKICDELQRLTKDGPFKRRYIETEPFLKIAPFVDWQKMVGRNPR